MEKFYEQSRTVNTLPTHAYYIPFEKKGKVFEDRRKSARYLDLNGEWAIEEYKSLLDVADDFYKKTPCDKIEVPSCVQVHGYDQLAYINTAFPFPDNPPFVPNMNPSYHYQRYFTVKADGMKRYLCFEGVDSCFYLYINNKFVGFSQVAHRLSEFDITDYLVDGENKMDILVLKWCMGSYLECQDKRRYTGIFRDVYILARPEGHVVDYRVDTALDGTVGFTLEEGESATVSFEGESKKVKKGERVEFKVENPKLWSAENPYLYDMLIETKDEYIGEKVGIRVSEIVKGLYLLNGKPVKMRGVNRHDIHYKKGATVSVEDIILDLTLMKKLNVNAIRTSHYPNCPEFYQLCDKMGFYVMDESDLECHGVTVCLPRYKGWGSYDRIANDPQFAEAIVDRQKCNVLRDKNRPSVVFWSMGNEAGYGVNFDLASAWIKSYDTSRPVHYERAISISKEIDGGKAYYQSAVDVVSSMYPPIGGVHEILNDPRESRPFILCEYCHSMGNGPGDFKAYWDIINSNDRFIGGYVWEWADHGLWSDEKGGLLYGGDHGETQHDGNFCMDGIITADRKLTQKSMEMKKAYEPVEFTLFKEKLTVKSRIYFEKLKGTLTVTYKNQGKVVGEDKFAIDLAPQEKIELTVKTAHVVIASLTLDEKYGVLDKGHELAREGWTANDKSMLEGIKPVALSYAQTNRYITVTAGETTFTLDKANASVVSIVKQSEILKTPLALSVWRAPTDNDMYVRKEWEAARLYQAVGEVRDYEIKGDSVTFNGYIAPVQLWPAVYFTIIYTFGNNAVSAYIDYKCADYINYLPRIGFETSLCDCFERVRYYGYGPYESYIDRRISCIKDVYEDTVSGLEVNYVMPQENGSHYDTEWLELTNGKTTIRVEDNFSFSALPHSTAEYTKANHDFELPARHSTHLCIDYAMAGIGSQSCGHPLDERWRVPKTGKGKFTLIIK